MPGARSRPGRPSGRGCPVGCAAWSPPRRRGYAQPSARLPEEALRLASLPVSVAIAARLDRRAEKERNRAEANAAAASTAAASTATTAWSWPAVAAVAVPALILLAVALA